MGKNKNFYIGPIGPPVHGQSQATMKILQLLRRRELKLKILDTNGPPRSVLRIMRNLKAVLTLLPGGNSAYISVNSNSGMWLSAALAGVARLTCPNILLHHHAYDQARRRKRSMAALGRLAGPNAVHIVLGEKMSVDLKSINPEVKRTIVVNNAGFIDLPRTIAPEKSGSLVIGHLSNLTEKKGVGQVVETAKALLKSGFDIKVRIAGATHDEYSQAVIRDAIVDLKGRFEYLGPIYDEMKQEFFSSLDVFLFPSLYSNEAAPLVLLEAMAAGVSCIALDVGCIVEQIGELGGLVVPLNGDYSACCIEFLREFNRKQRGIEARLQYESLLTKHHIQLDEMIRILTE